MNSTGLADLDLLNLDRDTGKPPASRLKDAKSADQIFKALLDADTQSAINRSRVQAMFDGAAPYDPAILAVSGQAARTNLNFGEAGRYLDIAVAGYVDLVNSVETLVNVTVKAPDGVDVMYEETVIAEEASRALREWPAFHTTYLRLVTGFVIHGVSVALFDDPADFRFAVSDLGDFLIPRQTAATEDAVEVASRRGSFMLHELYRRIRDPKAAKDAGWDVDACHDAMLKHACSGSGADRWEDWEALQKELKNNDLWSGVRAASIPVITTYAREFDGTVTMTLHVETDASRFLFRRDSMFPNPESAYLFFMNGVGTNGTFHSVRGLGQRIMNHIQISNRLRSQAVDGAMMSSAIMLRADSARSMENLSISYYGPYAILPPNVTIEDKTVPDLTRSVMPVIADVGQQMRENLDFYTTSGAAAGSPYRTKLQVQAELEAATRLTSANLNLFYNSWRRLLREVVRRLITGGKSDPAVALFHRRCAERNVGSAVLKRVDLARTDAVKAVGAGNATARVAALADLNELLPLLDEAGKKNLVFDRVAARVGFGTARRYVTPVDEQRPTYDGKLANLENSMLAEGLSVEADPTDLHESHLAKHIQLGQELLAAYEAGEADPDRLLRSLSVAIPHMQQHAQSLAGDPSAAAITAAANELLANAEMVAGNLQRAQQKQARDAAAEQQAAQPTADGGKLAERELRLEELRMRMELERGKAEMTMAMKQKDFEQKLALRDVQNYAALQRESVTPET